MCKDIARAPNATPTRVPPLKDAWSAGSNVWLVLLSRAAPSTYIAKSTVPYPIPKMTNPKRTRIFNCKKWLNPEMSNPKTTIRTLMIIVFLAPNRLIRLLADNRPTIEPNAIPNIIHPIIDVEACNKSLNSGVLEVHEEKDIPCSANRMNMDIFILLIEVNESSHSIFPNKHLSFLVLNVRIQNLYLAIQLSFHLRVVPFGLGDN